MKRIFVHEEWCLGCHLCEYNCAFANSGLSDMALALKGKAIYPRVHVEGNGPVSYAVSCRQCKDPLCVAGCIAGALSREGDLIRLDRSKCVGCLTCVLLCPYGATAPGEDGLMQKCQLCVDNARGEPACVQGCPNRAIVYEERG